MKRDETQQDTNSTFIEKVDTALRLAVAEMVAQRQASGQPLVVAKDGKVVWLKPEQITKGKIPLNQQKPEENK